LQELDHVSIMKPISKFAATVPHTQRIPDIIPDIYSSGTMNQTMYK